MLASRGNLALALHQPEWWTAARQIEERLLPALHRGENGDAAAFTEALDLLQKAVLLASGPRALFHRHAAHAASHTKDAATADRLAAALAAHWPRSGR
jgi:hypothetical protein